ncbi:MAG TPA: hypothetical protein VHA06_15640, partial [Candidatus Angelobacter sp.]|nr:hypothetical protein [Candidatus Angelobacter sp.]
QQNSAAASATQQKLPTKTFRPDGQTARKLLESSQANTCYTMRSYRFRQQDGQALVPAGMTTCTSANTFQQRQISRGQNSLFVPLGLAMKLDQPKSHELKSGKQKVDEPKAAQQKSNEQK